MKPSTIEIVLNGMKEQVVPGTTIKDLLRSTCENDGHVIVERNNRFVHNDLYYSTILEDGDKVEFINPDFGG